MNCTTFFSKIIFTFVQQRKQMAQKVHTGMRVDEDQLTELKYVAWFDRRSFTAVMEIAIKDYLDKWKKENGEITSKQIEDAKIN